MSQTKKKQNPSQPAYAKIRQMNRGSYDRDLAYEILDAGMVAHVGFVHENRPIVIPMAYARIDDKIFIHGASTTRIIKENASSIPVCLEVTLVDGLVVARSAFHHSMNYRSVIVHGTAQLITDEQDQTAALAAITDHLLPGRWDECRSMMPKELKATGVLSLSIEHLSTKVRTGGPVDDKEDLGSEIWAGVVPVTTAIGQPFAAYDVPQNSSVPASIPAARKKFA